MATSCKFLLHLLLLITSLQKAQPANCFYEDVSENAAIVGIGVLCFAVPESSALESATCVFRVHNATSVKFFTHAYGLAKYNRLETIDNGDNTLTVSLIQTLSYTGLLDTGDPPYYSATLYEDMYCIMESTTYHKYVYVDVAEENTQNPNFLETSYIYDVPEIWPVGFHFTIEEFGTPIIAEDRDNTVGNHESPSAEIIFELQGLRSEDFEVLTEKNFTKWLYTYRALLSSKKPFDYQVNPSHQFTLIARNADGKRESTVNVTVVIKDSDNLDPAFTSVYYSTSVNETMITTPGTYPLTCTPEIAAYDQDTGINQTLTYSISTDCGETSYCNILKTYFEINNITGALSYISNGDWPLQTTAISFFILASQVDEPSKLGTAQVIASFQLNGTVVFGNAH